MSMVKRVTLTINKNNTGVKLSSPLKFYKNDSLLLQFEIEKWNFDTKQNEMVKPMYAVALVETPDGTDMVECTILEGRVVQFQLLSRHTNLLGEGKLQIIVRDTHEDGEEPCQSATPPFEYYVEDLIYDKEILEDEDGNIIITEEGLPLINSDGFTTVGNLEEISSVGEESYLMITENGKSYKIKAPLLYNELLEKYKELENRIALLEQERGEE